MGRNKLGSDGRELEWSIQQGYVDACLQLGKRYIPQYTDEKGKVHPAVIQFHLGNANGGRTFMTNGIPDTLTLYECHRDASDLGVRTKLLWVEFKRHNGKTSKAQDIMIALLRACGQDVVVCHDTKTAVDTLLDRIGLVDQRSE